MKKVEKTEAQWRAQLQPEEYRILRQAGTERPFTGAHYQEERPGQYSCKACNWPLFNAQQKYHSGCGWPSFWTELGSADIIQRPDYSHGMQRIELLCPQCESHLGHIFNDGPAPTGLRYCINSASLNSSPKE